MSDDMQDSPDDILSWLDAREEGWQYALEDGVEPSTAPTVYALRVAPPALLRLEARHLPLTEKRSLPRVRVIDRDAISESGMGIHLLFVADPASGLHAARLVDDTGELLYAALDIAPDAGERALRSASSAFAFHSGPADPDLVWIDEDP